MLDTFHAHIFGRVQGVGFRYFTLNTANSLGGITGYVRNEYDGTVEVYAEGKKEILKIFLTHLRTGPSYGHVEDISVEWDSIKTRKFKTFKITY